MNNALLLDSDVLIDFLRQQPPAVAFLEGLTEVPLLSAVVVAELFSGVRDGDERRRLERLIAAAQVVAVNEGIATTAGLLRRQYLKSHRPELPDMLIAATALAHDATLVTLNAKHFFMLPNIRVPYRKGE